MATVELVGLRKTYGAATVLAGIDLSAADGEFVTLLGPSGCGKTTTLRCIAGLEQADDGEIRIGGRVVASRRGKVFLPPNKRDIGMVFQSYALWPHMTVLANVAYPLRVRRTDRRQRREAVMRVLAALGMADYAERPVTELSGGQQQRVALARAMVARPGVLLFDEPLSNLDAKLRRSMRKEIRDAHDRSGATSIYVTHDQEEAITLSDRVVVMREGTVQQVGTARDIYQVPATRFVADFLGFENLLPGEVAERRGASTAVSVAGGCGPVWADLGTAPAAGAVIIAARAGDLEISPLAPGQELPAAAVGGQVTSCIYAGGGLEYAVDVAGTPVTVRAREPAVTGGPGIEAGQQVWVRFDPARTVLINDNDRGDSDPAGTGRPASARPAAGNRIAQQPESTTERS